MVQTLPANFLYEAFHLLLEFACKILQFLNQNKSLRGVADPPTLSHFFVLFRLHKIFHSRAILLYRKDCVGMCTVQFYVHRHEQRGFRLAVMAG